MTKNFRVTASDGISVTINFNGDEVHIIASFSTNSTTIDPVQVKEDVETVSASMRSKFATPLSEKQIASICKEYATTSILALGKKYNVSERQLRSILNENGVQIRKQGQRTPLAKGKYTQLSDEQIASICKEYATTSLHNLMKKYHISENQLRSILNKNGVQVRKQGQRTPLTKGKYTQLSDEQIASICEEYATTSSRALMKKYHVSEKRLFSILNENDVQIRKHGQHPVASEKASVKTYDLEKIDSIINKREVHELRTLYHAIKKENGISTEELVKEHRFPIEFLEFATSEFELFTQKFILKMYNMGYSLEAISTRVKMPANQIRQLIPNSIIRSRGDKSHSVLTGERLKDTEKEAIKKCFANGESINDLADRFGVSPQTIKRYAL